MNVETTIQRMRTHVFQYFSYRPNLNKSAQCSLMKTCVLLMAEFGRLAHGWCRAMIWVYWSFERNITRKEEARLAPHTQFCVTFENLICNEPLPFAIKKNRGIPSICPKKHSHIFFFHVHTSKIDVSALPVRDLDTTYLIACTTFSKTS